MAKCLEPQIEMWSPPSIYKKSSTMNYVLTKTIAKLLDEPSLIDPYVEKGFQRLGEKEAPYLDEEAGGYGGDVGPLRFGPTNSTSRSSLG